MRSAGCISVNVRAHFSAPPPDRHAIRLPAVHSEQLYGMALTSFSVKSPSCGLSTSQACSFTMGVAPCFVYQQSDILPTYI